MCQDVKGFMWFGTWDGLNRYDGYRFKTYQPDVRVAGSISHNTITCIIGDRKGSLWIGTRGIVWFGTAGGGLNKLNRIDTTFTSFSKEDGLANNCVYGILEDNAGNLWLSTNRGISKFDYKNKQFKNFSSLNSGLQSYEFDGKSFFKNKNGEIFFGGRSGFNAFHPDSIHYNRIVLSKSITETEEIELLHNENIFSLEFAALHYASSGDNKYAYKLEGVEQEWNYAENRRFVTYTLLPPGSYVCKVKGSNNDGIWNEHGAALKITIIKVVLNCPKYFNPFYHKWQ